MFPPCCYKPHAREKIATQASLLFLCACQQEAFFPQQFLASKMLSSLRRTIFLYEGVSYESQ